MHSNDLGNSSFTLWNGTVQSEYTDVFFACILLGLHKPRCSLNTDDQTACNLWI